MSYSSGGRRGSDAKESLRLAKYVLCPLGLNESDTAPSIPYHAVLPCGGMSRKQLEESL